MLHRPVHWRLALLALVAAVLLVAMPTLTPVMTQAAGADVAHATQADVDARMPSAPMAMGVAARTPMHGAPQRGRHGDHEDSSCAYCPLLAGLLQWNASPVRLAARMAWVPAFVELSAARATTWRDTLGARGPPSPVAA